MNFFDRLPGFRQTQPGLERRILRLLPKVLLIGTLLSALPSVLTRIYPWSGTAVDIASRITTIDIYGISVFILHWTIVFTVAIGAFIVWVMKGPAYVADAYPLADSDHPDASSRS